MVRNIFTKEKFSMANHMAMELFIKPLILVIVVLPQWWRVADGNMDD